MSLVGEPPILNADSLSERYRRSTVRVGEKKILITNFRQTLQEEDLSEPPNCEGFGRVHHFARHSGGADWPPDPLPIDPACRALGLDKVDMLTAQVFQTASCNLRCWYCFVPFSQLSANPSTSAWLSSDELVDLYLSEDPRPPILDLSGGEPGLVPEWALWMIQALAHRGFDRKVYLWSDDNLTSDLFWRVLSDEDRAFVARHGHFGKVGCFKGFDHQSFLFNTGAAPALFDRQFELMRRYISSGLRMFAYVTLTTPSREGIALKVAEFVDRLQRVDRNLPLRTVPLRIRVFSPTGFRLNVSREQAMEIQNDVVARWLNELESRFSRDERRVMICDVPLGGPQDHRA